MAWRNMTPNHQIPADACTTPENATCGEPHEMEDFGTEAHELEGLAPTKDLVPKGLGVRVPPRAPLWKSTDYETVPASIDTPTGVMHDKTHGHKIVIDAC